MTDSNKYSTSVSELKNFPYKSSHELLNAYHSNEIQLGVDRAVARQWSLYNRYSPFWLKLTTYFLTISPYTIILYLLIYYSVTNNWLWLICLPIVYIAVDVLNPGSIVRYGLFQNVFKLSIGLSFIISILLIERNFIILSIALILQWLCIYSIYRITQHYILHYGIKNELVLCQLWEGNALNIFTKSGDRLTLKWKEVNGNIIWYEDEK